MKRLILSPDEVQAIYNKLDCIEKELKNQQKHIENPILTTEQVMNLLSVSRRCLQNWRDQGVIVFSIVGGKYFYRLSDINQMIDNHTVKLEG